MKNIKKLRNQNEGFTIIEVLIVLAIAGLIMLIVFLAVPALQRNSRNTARKSDVGRVGAAITEFSTSNNGKVPGTGDVTTVLNFAGDLAQYDTTNVSVASSATNIGSTNASNLVIVPGGKCGDDGATVPGSTRQVAIQYALEGSNTPVPSCQEV